MSEKKLLEKTNRVLTEYLADLDNYTLDQLQQKPADGSWSLGQVYIHLWMSAKGFFFKNAERCLNQEGTEQGKLKNWKGYLVFMMGQMPAIKVKMPDSVAVQPKMPESKAYVVAKLEEIKLLSADYIARISQSDASLKTKHPFLGWLNTAEWLALCNMHFKHHEAQKGRIRKHFGW